MNTPAPSFAQEIVNLFIRIGAAVLLIIAVAFGFAARATASVENEQLARSGSSAPTPSQPDSERKVR